MLETLKKIVTVAITVVTSAAMTTAAADDVNVAATIRPLHSLVQSVLGAHGEAALLVDQQSPHQFTPKPSHIRQLQNADIVFYIDAAGLENSLRKPLAQLPDSVTQVALIGAVDTLPFADEHDEHDDDHGGHDDHDDHDDHDKHGHDDHDDHGHDDHDDHGHDHSGADPHIWLSPLKAAQMSEAIARALAARYPHSADEFHRNADALQARLVALDAEVRGKFADLHRHNYIVTHDAYQYFERLYGLRHSGVIYPNVLVTSPSAEHLNELQELVDDADVECVFTEPQLPDRVIRVVLDAGVDKSGALDPLGNSLAPGADLYFGLIRDLADSFTNCLSD